MADVFQIIDDLAAGLKRLQPLKPEYQQRLDKKMRLEFNYNSNHIEGNTLTYGETELLLIFDKTSGNHELREYEEMKAHDVAFERIKEEAADKERPLTESAIKNLHSLLLVRPFWKEAITSDGQTTRRLIEVGNYKKYPNSVRLQNGEIFHYAPPEETPILMGELMQWYRDEENNGLHPLTLAAMLHYKFVRIHPFDDGNGRISRLLMNYVLLKNNLPPIIIKSADKKNYLFALNQADTGDYAPFIQYVAEQLVWSLQLSIRAAKGEILEEPNDWEKQLTLLKMKVSPNEEVYVKKTIPIVKETLENSIISVIEKLIEKLASFDELFSEKQMSFGSRSRRAIVTSVGEIRSLAYEDSFMENYTNGFSFEYRLKGFKKNGIHVFNVDVNVWWDLQEFVYYLFIHHSDYDKAVKKLYHQTYTEAEITNFVAQCAGQLLTQINQRQKKE